MKHEKLFQVGTPGPGLSEVWKVTTPSHDRFVYLMRVYIFGYLFVCYSQLALFKRNI